MAQVNKLQVKEPKTVKLTTATKNKLQHLSLIKGRTNHWLMAKAIDEYVEKEEKKEKLRQDTISRWKEVEEGKIISHDKITEWLDNWGKDNENGRP